MSWRRVRLPLAIALLVAAGLVLWQRSRGLQAAWLELGEPPSSAPRSGRPPVEQFPTSPRARLVELARGFDRPLFVTDARDGSGRLFVVEQEGRIRIVSDGRILPEPFLDVRRDLDSTSGERGLLGLAFAPDYSKSGVFYIAHTARGPAGVVRRFHVSSDPDLADPASAELVLSMEDPAGNHNGGMLAFGPDGYLWIGTGDGGSAGDPWGNAQNPRSLLGKMLRIDVRAKPYAVPADNPFVGRSDYRPEVWALGLRNPWRYSFDRKTGELWIGDVGQNAWEEIDVEDPKAGGGRNYGWNRKEAVHCYSPSLGCGSKAFTDPIWGYGHSNGCSVIGGYVYRGRAIPDLVGTYLFADYCRGTVWALDRDTGGGVEVQLLAQAHAASSFGEDENGELYLCDIQRGIVFRFDPGSSPAPTPQAD
jgi:glucose/arabinose dehydrogenase